MTTDANAYRRLIDIGRALSAEGDIDSLLRRILKEAKSNGRRRRRDAIPPHRRTVARCEFAIVLNDTLSIAQGEETDDPISLPDVPLRLEDGSPNLQNIASRAANTGETVVIDDVYSSDRRVDTSGTHASSTSSPAIAPNPS
ncbi:MAG: hypothetical protein U5O39_13410 [Gammaproteobacteria bacterium]|nr:hypothetical protein [Gammaproteobacteria bacterium]